MERVKRHDAGRRSTQFSATALVLLTLASGCSDGPSDSKRAAAPRSLPAQRPAVWHNGHPWTPVQPAPPQVIKTALISAAAADQPNTPALIRLPDVTDAPTPIFQWLEAAVAPPAEQEAAEEISTQPKLLPPEELPADVLTEMVDELPAAAAMDAPITPPPAAAADYVTTAETAAPIENMADSAQPDAPSIAQWLLADASPPVTGLPTGAMVNERARAKIRRGYALAQRGANFAARDEFIEVLQMIAQAKDQKHGAPRRTIALADGLRALDEAADFDPRGGEPDSQLSIAVILSSHQTPIARSADAEDLMPQQLAGRYFRYAQVELGSAVAGEPAGSMALHALGKLYSQLGKAEPDKCPQADRRAFALQQAALLARNDNHLAAHELGVLLAESGHFAEAEQLLGQVATREPHPVVFRNLARVQRKLGREHLAAASDRQAQLLATRGAGNNSVTWVGADALARTTDPTAPARPPARVAAGPPAPPSQRPSRFFW